MDLEELEDLSISEEDAIKMMEKRIFLECDISLVDGVDMIEDLLAGPEFDKFDDFFDYAVKRADKTACRMSWNTSTVYAKCRQCGQFEDVGVCLECLSKGNHEGHDITFERSNSGFCCCGNRKLWNESGTCKTHDVRLEDPAAALDRSVRIIVTGGIAAVLKNLELYAYYQKNLFLLSVRWIQRVLFLGDGIRRCIIRGMIKSVNLVGLFEAIPKVGSLECTALFSLFGSLLSDVVFDEWFCLSVVSNWPAIVKNHLKLCHLKTSIPSEPPLLCSQQAIEFSTHAFAMRHSELIVQNVDWVATVMETLKLLGLFVLTNPRIRHLSRTSVIPVLERLDMLIKIGTKAGTEESKIRFFDEFTNWLSEYEMKFLTVKATDASADERDGQSASVYNVMAYIADMSERIQDVSSVIVKKLYPLLPHKRLDLLKCVFSPDCTFGLTLILSKMAYFSGQSCSDFMSSCKEICDDTDHLFMSWATVPLRTVFAIELSAFKLFPQNSSSLLHIFHDMHRPPLFKHYLRLFTMIQGLWMKCENKGQFLANIAHISGIFHNDPEFTEQNKSDILFCFVYFVSCFVYDRMAMNNDEVEISKLQAISLIKRRPRRPSSLNRYWDWRTKDTVLERISDCATTSMSDTGVIYNGIHDVSWHPVLVCLRAKQIIQCLSRFTRDYTSLVKFPVLPPELREVLKEPIMFAVYYHVLSTPNIGPHVVQFVCNLLIDVSIVFSDRIEGEPETVFIVNTIQSLVEVFAGMSVSQFLHTPVGYCGRSIASVLDLISNMGTLGREVLVRMGLVQRQGDEQSESSSPVEKKEMAIQTSDIEYSEPQKKCVICHSHEGVLCCPVLVFKTAIPSIIQLQDSGEAIDFDKDIPISYSVRICHHYLHASCQKPEEIPTCPIDKSRINGFLPLLPNDLTFLQDEDILPEIRRFISLFQPLSDEESMGFTILRAFSGQIEILENRLRSVAHTVKYEDSLTLLSNFFLCLWKSRDLVCHIHDSELFLLSPLMHVILLTLVSDPSTLPLRGTAISSNASTLHGIHRHIFLRRVALFEHFALNKPITTDRCIQNWNEVLGLANLCRIYGVEEEEWAEPERFRFTHLPSNIMAFMKAPYDIDLSRQDVEIGVCLLTGTVLAMHDGETVPNVVAVLRERLGNTATILLLIRGPRLFGVVIADLEHDRVVETRSCYTDRYEAPGLGMRTGAVLNLSQERVDWLVEYFLSGEWTCCLGGSSS